MVCPSNITSSLSYMASSSSIGLLSFRDAAGHDIQKVPQHDQSDSETLNDETSKLIRNVQQPHSHTSINRVIFTAKQCSRQTILPCGAPYMTCTGKNPLLQWVGLCMRYDCLIRLLLVFSTKKFRVCSSWHASANRLPKPNGFNQCFATGGRFRRKRSCHGGTVRKQHNGCWSLYAIRLPYSTLDGFLYKPSKQCHSVVLGFVSNRLPKPNGSNK